MSQVEDSDVVVQCPERGDAGELARQLDFDDENSHHPSDHRQCETDCSQLHDNHHHGNDSDGTVSTQLIGHICHTPTAAHKVEPITVTKPKERHTHVLLSSLITQNRPSYVCNFLQNSC